MLPIIEGLLVLQERDERVAQLQAELTRTPLEVTALENRWKELCASLLAHETETRQSEVERKKLNLEAATTKTTIAKYRTQQQQTRKNEEFQALIHEIKHAEEKVSEIEDRELALMEKVADLEQKLAAEKAALKDREKEFQIRREELTKKKAALEEQLVKALAEQKNAEVKVEEPILLRYRSILSSKKSRAVVPVEHGVCGGCHMKLTTQTAHFVKANKDLITCDNCGRLIFSAE